MEILTNKWVWVGLVAFVVIVWLLVAAFSGITNGSFFTETPISEWTQSETIFYSAVLIALALFFGK